MSDFKIGTMVRAIAGDRNGQMGVVIGKRESEFSGMEILVVVYDCGFVDDTALPETLRIESEPEFPFTLINQLMDDGMDVDIQVIDVSKLDGMIKCDETPQERVARLLHETGHSN